MPDRIGEGAAVPIARKRAIDTRVEQGAKREAPRKRTPLRSVATWIASLGAAIVPALAHAAFTVTPITWNIVGLDSNAPATGPQHFPVGARVCSDANATNIDVSFVWDSSNPYINARPGSLTTLGFPSIPANGCVDAYFEVEVTKNAAAFDTTRRYHITASDGVDTASTSTPRELYVEHLISQNRNSITNVKVNGTSVPPGGSVGLVVGNTYTIELDGGTATQGYNQFQSFINFSNAIFQVLSVATTYSADNSPYVPGPAPAVNDKLYADACRWENNPGSVNYRSCVGGDYKAGGNNVVTVYTVKIIGGGGSAQALSSLLYDFSGASFHYNADYGVRTFIANIVDPSALTFSQAFTPATTTPGGTSTLTFTITNPNAAQVQDVGFSDTLPLLSGGQMVVATPATYSTQGCGTPGFTPIAGASALAVSNVTLPASGSCTINVLVSVPPAPATGSYVNTSGHLVVGAFDTGKNSTASLGLTSVAAPTNVCGLTLAQWTMTGATTSPPAPSTQASDVATASASAGAGISASIDTSIGNPVNGWKASGFDTATTLTLSNNDYFQFAVDTTNYTNITFAFDGRLASQGHGPSSLQLYVSTDGTNYSAYGPQLSADTNFATYAPAVTGANASGTTYWRIYGWNSQNSGASSTLTIDNITIGGCQTAKPQTITKTFAPTSIALGGTSTLTFTVSNPNTAPLTGVKFTDALPAGLQVATTPNASSSCGGSFTPAAGDTTLAFGQTSGATLAASSTCTVKVDVTATSVGSKSNVSGFVTSTEGGTNAGSGGSATATLQVITAPTIAAQAAPASVQVNGNALVTYTLTNPNAAGALSAVSFAASYPANLVTAANPSSNTCGGTLSAAPGGTSVSLSGGAIAAAGSCTVSVPVTSAVAGSYTITTGNVSDALGGVGNNASASVAFTAPKPAISVLKQVAANPAGPWKEFASAAPGAQVYYRFTVENTGDAPFASFAISDPTLLAAGVDPASCAWQTPNTPSTLPVLPVGTATIDPTATCVLGPVTVALGGHGNTATGHGVYNGTTYDSVASAADYVGALPGFSLVKEVSQNVDGPWSTSIAAAPGSNVFYRLTLVNTGAFDLTGISVADNRLDTSSCTFTDPLTVGDATVCTLGPVTVSQPAGTVITNTATGNGQGGGGSAVTPAASASYTVATSSADLAVTNTDNATTLTAGSSTQYVITVTNNGPAGVSNATLVDDVPAGLQFVGWNCAVTNVGSGGGVTTACASPGGTGSINTNLTLQPGAVITLQIAANVDANASGSITNTATISAPAGVFDPVSSNDRADDTDTVSTSADLGVTIDDAVTSVLANGNTTYLITVTNQGPAANVGAILQNVAAVGLNKLGVACGPAPGKCVTPPTVAELEAGVALPTLGFLETYQLAVATQVTSAGGNVTTTATIAGANDPNGGNNAASDTDAVIPAVVNTDLGIGVSDGVTSVGAGSALTYTIVASNNGPAAVTGASVNDFFPAAFVGASWTCVGSGGATCPANGIGNIAAAVDLPVGSQVTFTASGTVAISATGTLSNTATVSFGGVDTNPANNTATDTDTIVPAADLAVTIDDAVVSTTAGQVLAYGVRVTNVGPNPVTSATLTVPPAAGLIKNAVSCAATPGTCTVPPFIGEIDTGYTLPTLAPGESFAITIATTVTATQGSVTNVASVAVPGDVIDIAPANNTSSDVDAVIPPPPGSVDVHVTLDDGATIVPPGSNVTYNLNVGNSGPDPAYGVPLTVPFPATLNNVTWDCASATPGACPEPASGSGDINAVINLPAGVVSQFTIHATVAPAAVGTVTVTATTGPLSAPEFDTNAANDAATDSDSIGIPPPPINADLGVTISDGVTTATSGTTTTYTITVVNNGPDAVTGALLANPAVSGLAKVSVACGSPTCVTPPTVAELEGGSFALPSLSVGATYVVTVLTDVTGAPGVTPANTATVTAPAGVTDAVAGNNNATDTDTIVAPPPGPPVINTSGGNATWVKGAGPVPVDPGVIVADPGSTTELSGTVAITGAFRAGEDVLAFVNDGATMGNIVGSYNAATGMLTLTSAGGSATVAQWQQAFRAVTYTDTAGSPDLSTRTMSFTVSNGTQTSNTAPRALTLSVPAIAADLAVSVSASPSTVTAGGNVTYTVAVRNNGTADVANATLTALAPAGATFGSWTCAVSAPGAGALTTACGTASGSGSVSTTVTLNDGAVVTYTIAANVSASASGTIANSASVNMPAGVTDAQPANNSAGANVNVQATTPPPPPPPPAVDPQPIPTLGDYALILLALLLAGAAAQRTRLARRPVTDRPKG